PCACPFFPKQTPLSLSNLMPDSPRNRDGPIPPPRFQRTVDNVGAEAEEASVLPVDRRRRTSVT
ncbi:MAG: hypothetical protein QGH94_19265, partial [Phycisphaerae bacterium]|nr:hypothetical protein [Phycisphaerae bacterium]